MLWIETKNTIGISIFKWSSGCKCAYALYAVCLDTVNWLEGKRLDVNTSKEELEQWLESFEDRI